MKRFAIVCFFLVLVCSVSPPEVFPQSREKMTLVKVAEGVYMFQNSRGSSNSTVVITEDGVLVLDFHIGTADQTLAGIRLVEKGY